MLTSEKAKRKNDDTLNGRSSILVITVLSLGAFVALLIFIIPRFLTEDSSSVYPDARLIYTSDYVRYSLNLRTGTRTQFNGQTAENISILSPDGLWLVRWEMSDDYRQGKLMLQDAKTHAQPTSIGLFFAPRGELSWTTDSQSVVLSAYPNTDLNQNDEELWRVNITTGDVTRLTNNNYRDSLPAVSPDGTQIAYTSAADGYNRLYVMNIATGTSRLLTPTMFGYSAAWSPDGQWIAYVTNHIDPNGDIWIIRADGSDAQAITTGKSQDDNPGWLP